MNLPTPIGIEGESPQALAAFREYVRLGKRRSIRALSRRLSKSRTLLDIWSRKHHWQQRLRDLETAEALAANERAAEADRKAKEETALLIQRERLRFVRREIEAAELVTAKALEILQQPYASLHVR